MKYKVKHKWLRKQLSWTTAMGVNYLIKDLKDDHLVNIILCLQKKINDLLAFELPLLQINGRRVDDWILILKNELKYRKIK